MLAEVPRIGSIVRSARESRGLTQIALADIIGVSKQTIGEIENDRRFPSYEVFYWLMHAMNTSSDFFIFHTSEVCPLKHHQMHRELNVSNEREQKIVDTVTQSLLWALRHDEPEKQG